MKKLIQFCLLLLIVLGLLNVHHHPVVASTVLSDPLLIPESPAKPVRVKLPNVPDPLEITTMRVWQPGMEIAPDNQAGFKILCPDLTEIEVLPGKLFTCPPPPAATFVVQLPPPIEIVPPPPIRGDQETMFGPVKKTTFTPAEKSSLQEAVREINQFTGGDDLKRFLLANLYTAWQLYPDALAQLENQPMLRQNPAALRLLGELYLRTEKLREAGTAYHQALALSQNMGDLEGQAFAHHELALIYERFNQKEEALQQGRSALEIYQKIGRLESVTQIQAFLEKLSHP